MSDQDRINPKLSIQYQELVMRIKKNINYVYQVDPITNPLNKHHRNCLENSKNNYHWDLGSRRVN